MIIKYQNTDNVLQDICSIIDSAKDFAYQSVNMALINTSIICFNNALSKFSFNSILIFSVANTTGLFVLFP